MRACVCVCARVGTCTYVHECGCEHVHVMCAQLLFERVWHVDVHRCVCVCVSVNESGLLYVAVP